jgi:hypothetical protein
MEAMELLLQKKHLSLPWMHAQLHIREIKKWNRDQKRCVWGSTWEEQEQDVAEPERGSPGEGEEETGADQAPLH